jgi:alkylated DNA repair dioxygenase AlkB
MPTTSSENVSLTEFITTINDDRNTNNEQNNNIDKFNFIPKRSYKLIGSLRSGLNILFITNYLNTDFADTLFENLKKVKYNSDEESMIKILGKQIKIPRKQIAFGEPGANYHFSGTNVKAYDWNRKDNEINSIVARDLKDVSLMAGRTATVKFNYALVNNYLDETNSIGYHADDEKELGAFPVIAGISLGSERCIHFKSNNTGEVTKLSLPHNSMYIMFFPTNKFWKHAIPKSTRSIGQRISITFRGISN